MTHDDLEWRDVTADAIGLPVEEGRYQVSERGDVLDLQPKCANPNPYRGGRLLTQTPDGRGYLLVRLAGVKVQQRIHRLVALSFGKATLRDECVRHLDDDKSNNHVSNLEGGTESANRFDCVRNNGYRSQNHLKTHCVRGHEFSLENTRVARDGRRKCVACDKEYQRAYYQRKRAERLQEV